MNSVLMSLAVLLFSVVSPEVATKIYLGLDSKDEAKSDFAFEMIQNTLHNPRLAVLKPGARLFVFGDAIDNLIAGSSTIESPVSELVNSNADFKIIACGKAVSSMRERVKSGKIKLIPGVELVNDCSLSKKDLQKTGWLEVEIEAGGTF